jgi:predicted amidohydrolase YtcJ
VLSGRSDRLRWAGLKCFADGSLGGHTAAMIDPFADRPTERGTLRLTGRDAELARRCVDLGGTVAIHAIGDLACREVITLFETLDAPAGRSRIEHASVIRPKEIERMAKQGIIGCVQPAFLGSEAEWLERRVGAERLGITYPFATMEAMGVVLGAGSDSPVEPPQPWAGMALARHRAGVAPAEGLSATRALALYTEGAAAALGEPPPLAVGSPADVIVVDRDPVSVSPEALGETRVHHTFVGGDEVELDHRLPNWVE